MAQHAMLSLLDETVSLGRVTPTHCHSSVAFLPCAVEWQTSSLSEIIGNIRGSPTEAKTRSKDAPT